jgi:FKBP-type peptidyl-prolyl cis-trans isomerase 2
MSIKNGDRIKVEFEGRLNDGTIFHGSEDHAEFLEFEVGCGQMIPGFENAVIGMENGEQKEFTLESPDAFGDHDPNLVRKVPRDQVAGEVSAGMVLVVQLPDGVQVPVKVLDVSEKDVTIDMNHPLAGETLNFKVKILDVSS